MASSSSGWSRGKFGEGKWGTATTVVAVDGSAGTTSLGDESVAIDFTHAATSDTLVFAFGFVSFQGQVSISVTGVVGTMGIGDEHLWNDLDTSQTPSFGDITTTQTPGWTDIVAAG